MTSRSSRSGSGPISSTSTATEWGSSSRTRASAFSRISSATRCCSGSSLVWPSGYSGRPSGRWRRISSTSRSSWVPLRAETGTTSAKSASPAAAWRAAATLAREATSILLTTHSLGVATLATSAARKRSPAPTPAAASTSWRTRSTSDRVPRTRSLSRWPSRVRGLWRPGVSTSTIWPSGRCSTPRTAERVVCGLSETMASFWPRRALSRVDLPTLGRPTSATSPDFI